jgi:hypothetical protein
VNSLFPGLNRVNVAVMPPRRGRNQQRSRARVLPNSRANKTSGSKRLQTEGTPGSACVREQN